ncbi:hypothetical protein C8J57DRAFT_1474456 [Mycena rebaudengoi]|nr:hypothetical protein C8J57DRAFT_1474456 [Mycena rebaudengoi]
MHAPLVASLRWRSRRHRHVPLALPLLLIGVNTLLLRARDTLQAHSSSSAPGHVGGSSWIAKIVRRSCAHTIPNQHQSKKRSKERKTHQRKPTHSASSRHTNPMSMLSFSPLSGILRTFSQWNVHSSTGDSSSVMGGGLAARAESRGSRDPVRGSNDPLRDAGLRCRGRERRPGRRHGLRARQKGRTRMVRVEVEEPIALHADEVSIWGGVSTPPRRRPPAAPPPARRLQPHPPPPQPQSPLPHDPPSRQSAAPNLRYSPTGARVTVTAARVPSACAAAEIQADLEARDLLREGRARASTEKAMGVRRGAVGAIYGAAADNALDAYRQTCGIDIFLHRAGYRPQKDSFVMIASPDAIAAYGGEVKAGSALQAQEESAAWRLGGKEGRRLLEDSYTYLLSTGIAHTVSHGGFDAARTRSRCRGDVMYGDPVYEDLGDMLNGSAGRFMGRDDLRASVECGGRGQIARGGV